MKIANVLSTLILVVISINGPALASADLLKTSQSFKVELNDGKTISMASYLNGKPTYIKFWATWCQPCIKEMPHLQHTFEEYGDDLNILSVNLAFNDDNDSVRQFMQDKGLDFPVALDDSGALTQHFKMIGTPYHLLFDGDGKLVHRGHEANEQLDDKIALLATKQSGQLASISLTDSQGSKQKIKLDKGVKFVLFSATWCDWYWKETKPESANACVNAQQQVNQVSKQLSQTDLLGVFSRMWTGEKELANYQQRLGSLQRNWIDTSNSVFYHYQVQQIPTLLVIKDGQVVERMTDFKTPEKLMALAKQY